MIISMNTNKDMLSDFVQLWKIVWQNIFVSRFRRIEIILAKIPERLSHELFNPSFTCFGSLDTENQIKMHIRRHRLIEYKTNKQKI